jgi:hypothetical protein
MKRKSGPPIRSPKAGAFDRNLGPLVERVRTLVLSARRAAASSVNTFQVLTSFEIGRLIVEHEQQGMRRAEYGEVLIKTLSDRLTAELGRGFSKANLEYMQRFYLIWKDRSNQIAQKASGQLPEISKTASAHSPDAGICQTVSGKLSPIAQEASGQLPAATEGASGPYVKGLEEHPTVGIILCKKKYDALVEITLPKEANIFASAYQLYLPSKEDLRQQLLEWTRVENAQ